MHKKGPHQPTLGRGGTGSKVKFSLNSSNDKNIVIMQEVQDLNPSHNMRGEFGCYRLYNIQS